MAGPYLLAIDQGTTSTRAVVYDPRGHTVGLAARDLPQSYPRPGWVEHDAEEIWSAVEEVVPRALTAANVSAPELAAIGVTNQRETVLAWDRDSLQAFAPAIVWQDRRTADFCRERATEQGWLSERTGLVLDPYFSATKIRWLLQHHGDVEVAAQAGRAVAGTIDTFLLHRLTGGRVLATDVTNASRTLLLDIRTRAWDAELAQFFGVPMSLLPEVRPSIGDFGTTRGLRFLPDGIPIRGVAGDQQAALFGQGGFAAGAAKCTYGTGAFFLRHTGTTFVRSQHGLLTSLAATTLSEPEYVIEGSAFVAGAAVQWLRDGLQLFSTADAVESLAARSDPDQPIVFIPGLVGLGAPHWVPQACGVVFGITRATSTADLARATLEGVAAQVGDLIEAAGQDVGEPLLGLRADGGMARNDWFLQCQANVLGLPVTRAAQGEATALGAAFLAGLGCGLWSGTNDLVPLIGDAGQFYPQQSADQRASQRARWRRAVEAVISFYAHD